MKRFVKTALCTVMAALVSVGAFAQQKAEKGKDKAALNEGKTGKEVEVLLESYLAAKEDCDAIDKEAVAKYKTVLPIEKVAKIFIAEEQFRHQQIKRLNKDHKPGEGHQQMQEGNGRQHQRGNGQSSFRGNRGWNDGFEE